MLLAAVLAAGVVRVTFFLQSPPHGPVPSYQVPALGAGENGRFQGRGVSFRYPAGWGELADPLWRSSGTPTGLGIVGIDPNDKVVVQTFALRRSVSKGSFPEARAETVAWMQRSTRASGAYLEGEPIDTKLAGVPAVEFHLHWTLPGGTTEEVRTIFAFRGTIEYQVTCLSTPTHSLAMATGCAQVLRTFRLA